MAVWQKRARFAVAVVFITSAVVVYFAIGRRPQASSVPAVKRIDPAASVESVGGTNQRFRGNKRDYEINWDSALTYADGRTRMKNVVIKVKKDDGRSYLVTAGEGEATQDQSRFQLSFGVHLRADDGFEMTADRATYTKADGLIHSDVPVTFTKGRMSGSGTNVDYNETGDVLSVARDAHVTMVDEEGATTLDFVAGSAVLDRFNDVLTLDGGVHVLRDMQTMDADRANARLAPNDDTITFIEMRGNSRVGGGSSTLDAMSARDIDLDYSDDGTLLERVALNGSAGLTTRGANDTSGWQLTGERLDVALAPDGTVTSAMGRENVRMVLPATDGNPARTVTGRTLDAVGAPGAGLTEAHFVDAVEYREGVRAAHSQRLDLALSADAVTSATFVNDVTFEEPSFRAQAAHAQYNPMAGTLHLTGGDRRGQPCVADDRIAVDAQTIDVTVETRRLNAVGAVKTTLRPEGATAPATSPCAVALRRAGEQPRAAKPAGDSKLPGLLKQDQLARSTSDTLEYGGTGQALVFKGNASLFQGDTAMRGDTIRIDQESGNLIVSGGARALIVAGTGAEAERVNGRAEEISYTESRRLIEYRNAPAGAAKRTSGTVRVTAQQWDLEAASVEVFLGKDDGRVERLEAYDNVTSRIDTKTATAGRLTYLADKDQYDMKAGTAASVKIVDGCAETVGKTVTYYRRENRTFVDGKDELRTQSRNPGCQQPSPSPR